MNTLLRKRGRKKDRERRVVENKEKRRVVAIGESKKYKDEIQREEKKRKKGILFEFRVNVFTINIHAICAHVKKRKM